MKRLLLLFSLVLFSAGPFLSSITAHGQGVLPAATWKKDSLAGTPAGPLWTVGFVHNGQPVTEDTTLYIIEAFVNNRMVGRLEGRPGSIDVELTKLSRENTAADVVTLILLNSRHTTITVVSEEGELTTSREDIPLNFYPGQQVHYRVETGAKQEERSDYFFFYIEKSGGIRNLRDFRERFDPVVERKDPFLVFFNDPAGNPMIVSDTTGIRNLYNVLFTSITQPPMPREEVRRVIAALNRFVPANSRDINMHLVFYLSEISHGMLSARLCDVILGDWLPSGLFNTYTVTILTDFDVPNKRNNIKYINISETD